MDNLVIDASIAVKWVVEEEGTEAAIRLRPGFRLIAPELIVAECANILWKKVQRGEMLADEARLAARLLERSGTEIVTTRGMMEQATDLAVRLAHPAYDCIYLSVAQKRSARFVTADQRLLRVIAERAPEDLARLCISLHEVHETLR